MKNKNIFILPTTDPSQVYLVKSTNALGLTSNNPESMEHYGSGTHNQHVYITNKDPYDRGDWCIDIEAQEIFKVAEVKEYSGIVRSDTDTYVYDACAKIVITSDPKLIADGIAGIDIEFLRLLKDKKLDEISTVEVEKTPLLSNNGRALYGYKYTPIIRKKNIVVLAGEDAVKEERERGLIITHINKKETLQEVAERILANNIIGLKDALNDDDLFLFYKEVILCYGQAMAEWQKENEKRIVSISSLEDGYQQELFNYLHSELDVIALQSQMHDIERIVDNMPSKNIYSEADMREMYNKSCGQIGLGELNDQTENNNRFREFIEQIKNK